MKEADGAADGLWACDQVQLQRWYRTRGNWKTCCCHGGRARISWLLWVFVRRIAHVFIEAVCISVITKEKFDFIGKRKRPIGSYKTAFSNSFSCQKQQACLASSAVSQSEKTTVVFVCPVGILYNSVML